ncbi:MAG TPA: hypothetical protein VMU20_17570 [Candidatus Dormibacteraeota bacterium]|nr:hypothetical protein [Candidatus Dormibacteraeota bacterium]
MTDLPPPPRTLQQLAAIADPVERAKAISAAIADLRSITSDLASLRRDAILELRRGGMLQADVAKLLGVSYGRVSQLEAAGRSPSSASTADREFHAARWHPCSPR